MTDEEILRRRMEAAAVGGMGPNVKDVHMDNVYQESLVKNPVEEIPSANKQSSPNAMAAAQAIQGASQANNAGNAATTAGSGLMAAGAVPTPASPYLIAGGAALSAIGSIQAKKEQRKIDKAQNTQKALANIQQLGQNFRL